MNMVGNSEITGTLSPSKKRVYLDYNATTPIDAGLQLEVVKWLKLFGNPSSIHTDGRGPKQLIRESRQSIAELIGCHPLELVMTSGGSEANSLALLGGCRSIRRRDPKRTKVIVSSVEHPSVLKTSEQLSLEGFEVIFIQVDRDGRLDLEHLKHVLDQTTAMVSVMFANNETGVIHPLKEVIELSHAVGAKVHSDGVQSVGKAIVNLNELRVDYMSFSGHKFYALKGSGFLFVRSQSPLEPLIAGGGQERRRRAGTENMLGIAAMGFMARELKKSQEGLITHQRNLRDHFEKQLADKIPNAEIIGADVNRNPNVSLVIFKDVSGESLLMNLDVNGFSVSTGAACSSGNPEPSPALLAMGLSFKEAQSSMRVSFGKDNTLEQVDAFGTALAHVVDRLRSINAIEEEHDQGLDNQAGAGA